MLNKRVIPCLLLQDGGLVKTVQFKSPTYIGDPINAVKIFNDKEVDEIVFLDIDATKKGLEPNFGLIEQIVEEAFMPFAYGGGINNLEQVKKLFSIGVEKVVLNYSAYTNPQLVKDAVSIFGSQSIVGSLDVKKNMFRKEKVFIKNGTINTKSDPEKYAKYLESIGVGEIFLNNIDKDGKMNGYDISLCSRIVKSVKIPVVLCGGAGSLADIKNVIVETDATAVSAGSLFVYHGKHNGVLINYPSREFIESL